MFVERPRRRMPRLRPSDYYVDLNALLTQLAAGLHMETRSVGHCANRGAAGADGGENRKRTTSGARHRTVAVQRAGVGGLGRCPENVGPLRSSSPCRRPWESDRDDQVLLRC
jgi:hypothetical protein